MHLLVKQRGVGRENDNCVRLKLTKNTCALWLVPQCAGCMIRPIMYFIVQKSMIKKIPTLADNMILNMKLMAA